jgi:hypothetical protein
MTTNKPIEWYPSEFQPDRPICVLAWDQEAHYIAVFENAEWHNAHTGEPIDTLVTHWAFLPEPQEEQP